jgi:hypothetical protein
MATVGQIHSPLRGPNVTNRARRETNYTNDGAIAGEKGKERVSKVQGPKSKDTGLKKTKDERETHLSEKESVKICVNPWMEKTLLCILPDRACSHETPVMEVMKGLEPRKERLHGTADERQ